MNEDLIRLEQKIDMIMFALQESNLMHRELPSLMGIESDLCALCRAPIRLVLNPSEGTILRACKCSLPKKAYKLEPITQLENKDADNRAEEKQVPSYGEE